MLWAHCWIRLIDLGFADNTIIIFASDNGGNMYNEVDGTTATSNAPLRGGKATMYEGGVRGPAIVAFPGRVQAGSRSDEVIQSCDFYPTLLELLDIKPQPDQSFDGISIVPALQGKRLDREGIFTYFPHSPGVPDWLPPAVSVHSGDWKLIRIFYGGENGQHRWKLFNLRDDLGEQHDLASKFPERVQELDALIEAFLADTGRCCATAESELRSREVSARTRGQREPERKHTDSQKGASRCASGKTNRRVAARGHLRTCCREWFAAGQQHRRRPALELQVTAGRLREYAHSCASR